MRGREAPVPGTNEPGLLSATFTTRSFSRPGNWSSTTMPRPGRLVIGRAKMRRCARFPISSILSFHGAIDCFALGLFEISIQHSIASVYCSFPATGDTFKLFVSACRVSGSLRSKRSYQKAFFIHRRSANWHVIAA